MFWYNSHVRPQFKRLLVSCPIFILSLLQVRPEFLGAIFDAYKVARVLPFALTMKESSSSGGSVDGLGEAAHELLQLLIMLASVTGPIFGAQGVSTVGAVKER